MSRRRISGSMVTACLIAAAWTAVRADTHYVSLSGGNQGAFTSWATAATNMADGVAALANGDTLLVSNGIYYATRDININNMTLGVTISAPFGAAQTIYNGGGQKLNGLNSGASSIVYVKGITFTNFIDPDASNNRYAIGMSATLFLESCVLAGCRGYDGGAILVASGGSLYATNCVIKGNSGTRSGMGGGALSCIYATKVMLDKCQFIGNTAASMGGGVNGGSGLTIRNCLFSGNTAGGDGGGVNVYNGTDCLIENCTIVSNTCGYDGGGGISIRTGGAAARIRNCLIAANTSIWRGGGIHVDSTMLMENCTVVSNVCGIAGANGTGGGVYYNATAGSGTAINSIVYFNTRPGGGTTNYIGSPASFWINTCTAPNPGASLSSNCIDVNPQFVDSDGNDFHPKIGSPCIDAGTNQAWMTNAVDLDGRMRIREGLVDMGAYEWVPKCILITTY